MTFTEMRTYLETGFAARHLPTGRVFVLVPSHDLTASVLGGKPTGFIPVVESLELVHHKSGRNAGRHQQVFDGRVQGRSSGRIVPSCVLGI